MAEPWTVAFGRYLRTLRERQGLSLQDVASLSQSFPDTINKGYLSRCENGKQRLGFSKVIPLSHICKVPADVLLERMELDLELERVGGPKTEGMNYADLATAGKDAMHSGYKWEGYGFIRDAVVLARTDPVRSRFKTREEQIGFALMACALAAKSLGKYRLSLHELVFVQELDAFQSGAAAVLLDRISSVHRELGDEAKARELGAQAVELAERFEEDEFLGHIYESRGVQAYLDGELDLASSLFRKAHRVFRDAGFRYGCAITLNNLAQVYFDVGRLGAARKTLEASLRTTAGLAHNRSRALAHILLGEIDERDGRSTSAAKNWREAVGIANELKDKVLRFKAEFYQLRQAHALGNEPVMRAIQRRLLRLANYVPSTTPELRDFQEFVASSKRAS